MLLNESQKDHRRFADAKAGQESVDQTNLLKLSAGLNPLDPTSRFTLTIAPVPDPARPEQFLAGQRSLVFRPRLPDRSHAIEFRASLGTGTGHC